MPEHGMIPERVKDRMMNTDRDRDFRIGLFSDPYGLARASGQEIIKDYMQVNSA